jgi:hypothetical protein
VGVVGRHGEFWDLFEKPFSLLRLAQNLFDPFIIPIIVELELWVALRIDLDVYPLLLCGLVLHICKNAVEAGVVHASYVHGTASHELKDFELLGPALGFVETASGDAHVLEVLHARLDVLLPSHLTELEFWEFAFDAIAAA